MKADEFMFTYNISKKDITDVSDHGNLKLFSVKLKDLPHYFVGDGDEVYLFFTSYSDVTLVGRSNRKIQVFYAREISQEITEKLKVLLTSYVDTQTSVYSKDFVHPLTHQVIQRNCFPLFLNFFTNLL